MGGIIFAGDIGMQERGELVRLALEKCISIYHERTAEVICACICPVISVPEMPQGIVIR